MSDGPSHARWVGWRALDQAVAAPIAWFSGAPGGSVDQIAMDRDVTTFLNDRFSPVFEVGEAETVQFLTADGCAFGLPLPLRSAEAFIDAANLVIVADEARGRQGSSPRRDCPGGDPPAPR